MFFPSAVACPNDNGFGDKRFPFRKDSTAMEAVKMAAITLIAVSRSSRAMKRVFRIFKRYK
jgi:hypothetical protein